ncbi:MAG: hypothetical protein AUK49_01315 [Betaproteobacteria bacterium CG2_30_68_42]|nr:MAG: hypothetical protein AUK49_01315 [Betaproteobacteria bacterium CG2_30_68_42]
MDAANATFFGHLGAGLLASALVGLGFALVLLAKSLRDFTRTGPQMTEEVLSHYRGYLLYALARLVFFAFLIASFLAFLGVAAYAIGLALFDAHYSRAWAAGSALLAIALLVARMFARTLLWSPGVIAASSLYSMSHFYGLWARLSPRRLHLFDIGLAGMLGSWLAAGVAALALQGAWAACAALAAIGLAYVIVPMTAARDPEPAPVKLQSGACTKPNILLIGSDTLRADRVNGAGYPRALTPNLDRLIGRAARFTDCYVPCARTAPSLASLLTGAWPHTHGVRDTFVTPDQTRLPIPALPEILRQAGYRSAIVGDWAASDADKFTFGFDYKDLPHDQWNIKYLLRQGPKDLRLFLALFAQNPFGKRFLPEIHFLGGHPLTEEVGRDTRRMIARLSDGDAPFFLVSFMATTHPPFTSKYPYYTLYSHREYQGESKFGMAKLRDPWEIIRRQGEPKSEFDLEQIIDLYDGCVRNFDDETGRVMKYLAASGLAENTIVVVFSDHGFEFFEHDTWGQGNSAVGDFSARVPLVIADPRHRQPRKVSDVVRTVDVAPTLLELAGLAIPASMEGVSLAPSIRGEPFAFELPAFYETGVWLTDLPGTPENHLRYPSLPDLLEIPDKRLGLISLKPGLMNTIIAAKDRMVRWGEWKLSYQPLSDGALYRLFNIREDPGCRQDVLSSYPDVATRLQQMLAHWMAADTRMASGVTGNTAGAAGSSDHRAVTRQAFS